MYLGMRWESCPDSLRRWQLRWPIPCGLPEIRGNAVVRTCCFENATDSGDEEFRPLSHGTVSHPVTLVLYSFGICRQYIPFLLPSHLSVLVRHSVLQKRSLTSGDHRLSSRKVPAREFEFYLLCRSFLLFLHDVTRKYICYFRGHNPMRLHFPPRSLIPFGSFGFCSVKSCELRLTLAFSLLGFSSYDRKSSSGSLLVAFVLSCIVIIPTYPNLMSHYGLPNLSWASAKRRLVIWANTIRLLNPFSSKS